MNSRHKRAQQTLGGLSAKEAEAFLFEWANLPGPWPMHFTNDKSGWESMKVASAAAERIQKRYASLAAGDLYRAPSFLTAGDLRKKKKEAFLEITGIVGNPWLREMLRRAWDTPDSREREWLCFRIRDHFAVMMRRRNMTHEEMLKEESDVTITGPRYTAPPITPFEAAIFHFQNQDKRVRHCRNPECQEPYFFARKRNQEYCSPDCAEYGQRESKKKWWNENRGKSKRRKNK
jgi:hypothetical protein